MPYRIEHKVLPGETSTLTVDFEDRIPAGLGLHASGHTVGAVEHWSQTTDNTILSSTTPTISGYTASVVLSGLLLGERYDVTFLIRLNDATPSVIPVPVLVMCVENLD